MTGILYVGLGVVLALGLYVIRAVRREYRTAEILSPLTVAAVWALYALHAAVLAVGSWHGLWPIPVPRPLSLSVGGTLTVAGLVFALAGTAEFRSFRRMSGMLSNRLVTSGPYRWSRNPQNVGWGAAFVGAALLGRSGFALLLASVFWAMFLAYLPEEEAYLERIFGEEYRRYVASTPRLLGFPTASPPEDSRG